jgi:hypothetical protein
VNKLKFFYFGPKYSNSVSPSRGGLRGRMFYIKLQLISIFKYIDKFPLSATPPRRRRGGLRGRMFYIIPIPINWKSRED